MQSCTCNLMCTYHSGPGPHLLQPDVAAATDWELAAACLNHRDRMGKPDCVGFTRNMWGGGTLWRAITDPFDGWGKWMVTPSSPCGGMYVKGK